LLVFDLTPGVGFAPGRAPTQVIDHRIPDLLLLEFVAGPQVRAAPGAREILEGIRTETLSCGEQGGSIFALEVDARPASLVVQERSEQYLLGDVSLLSGADRVQFHVLVPE